MFGALLHAKVLNTLDRPTTFVNSSTQSLPGLIVYEVLLLAHQILFTQNATYLSNLVSFLLHCIYWLKFNYLGGNVVSGRFLTFKWNTRWVLHNTVVKAKPCSIQPPSLQYF